jgi:hypothetical protein
MKTSKLLAAFVLLFVCSPAIWAVDDGQTRPKLSYGTLSSGGSVDIIATTNGSGNIKGIHCLFENSAVLGIYVYVNGGSAQVLPIDYSYFPQDINGYYATGFIPYNIRFGSSIRVQMSRTAGSSAWTNCVVSWALD